MSMSEEVKQNALLDIMKGFSTLDLQITEWVQRFFLERKLYFSKNPGGSNIFPGGGGGGGGVNLFQVGSKY